MPRNTLSTTLRYQSAFICAIWSVCSAMRNVLTKMMVSMAALKTFDSMTSRTCCRSG